MEQVTHPSYCLVCQEHKPEQEMDSQHLCQDCDKIDGEVQ